MTDTQFLSNTYNDQNIVSTSIHKKFKEVFKFLEWKTNEYDPHFSIRDREIISSSMYGQYHELSDKACTYTQHEEIHRNSVVEPNFSYKVTTIIRALNVKHCQYQPALRGNPRSC